MTPKLLVSFCLNLSLLWLVTLPIHALEFGCPSDFCAKNVKECPTHEIETGRILKNATKCGCCDVMMISLNKNDKCNSIENTPIPRSECGPRLTCDPSVEQCKEANTQCMRDFVKFEATIGVDELSMGMPKPKCNDDGLYEPVQCKQGLMCKCLDKNGKRIFGEAPHIHSENMNCQCSRDFNDYVEAGLLEKDTPYFLRCASNGDYDGPQCTETHCYCIGKNGELRSQQVLRLNGTAVLPCFDPAIHHKNFVTPCLQERELLLNQTKTIQSTGTIVLGIDLPNCDLDGSFAAKQCVKDECFCVDKFNKRYEATGVKRFTKEEKDMYYCNCVREKDYLKNIIDLADQFAQYKCMENGNYLPIQCTPAVCFCVDPIDGFQVGSPKLISERTELTDCYKEEYEHLLNIMWD